MSPFVRRDPVLIVTLVTALASSSVPVLLVSGVAPNIVAVVSAVIGGYSAAAVAYLRSVVTPSAAVALTHDDVAALNAAVATPAGVQPPA